MSFAWTCSSCVSCSLWAQRGAGRFCVRRKKISVFGIRLGGRWVLISVKVSVIIMPMLLHVTDRLQPSTTATG